jgi:NAD(P)-dependent dehydrogenase (short-subunit alcohol dehydrogenase family)
MCSTWASHASAFACDVTNRDEVEALAQHAVNTHGRVDVIVTNAGIAQAPTPLIDMDLADFRRIFDVNMYGMLNGIQVFGKIFQEQGTPAGIYNLGSENSIYPCVPAAHAYVASKHAVRTLINKMSQTLCTSRLYSDMFSWVHNSVACLPGATYPARDWEWGSAARCGSARPGLQRFAGGMKGAGQ